MGKIPGDILSCTCRKLQLESDASVIRLRHEFSLDRRTDQAYSGEEYGNRDKNDYLSVSYAPVYQTAVASRYDFKELVEISEDKVMHPSMLRLEAQELRA
jgi:hypothetical protein